MKKSARIQMMRSFLLGELGTQDFQEELKEWNSQEKLGQSLKYNGINGSRTSVRPDKKLQLRT